MSSGRVHLTAGLAAGLSVSYLSGNVVGAELAGLAVVYGLAPDLDRGTSLAGGFVPRWLAPEVAMPGGGHGRRWFGLVTIPHHGPFHSAVTGLVLALPWAVLGWKWAAAAYLGWLTHLALDPRSQLLWPLSRRWFFPREPEQRYASMVGSLERR